MRWVFTDEELAKADPVGDVVRALFKIMKPQLERDEVRQCWVTRRLPLYPQDQRR